MFDVAEFDAFCLDYFPDVYDQLGEGMRKDAKTTLLLDYCWRETSRQRKLLAALEEYQ